MIIFVSYTLRDGMIEPAFLSRGAEVMSEVGQPFVDLLHNDSPDPQGLVLRRLAEASCFCALWTRGFCGSIWTRLEWRLALERGIPVVVLDLTEGPPGTGFWEETVRLLRLVRQTNRVDQPDVWFLRSQGTEGRGGFSGEVLVSRVPGHQNSLLARREFKSTCAVHERRLLSKGERKHQEVACDIERNPS
jgi:hypothetical protein